ncbi:sensor histidine kinase [Actinophytocola sp. NPDC049390]|uniref:sensor histidine kinase n=1 Tax=Actinophytocola sp. NPDC049390 TaxID=3363894 RepID=UPI0037B21F2A
MGRYLAVAAVLAAEGTMFVAGLHGHRGLFGLLVIAACALLAWTAYATGLTLLTRTDTALVAATALLTEGLQVLHTPAAAPQHIATVVMFVALPLLVGRYLAQHRTLVRTLDAHNRQLRTEQALLAEREQLRERLRIARDMHDSLGRRLSLVSVQAAAIEVGNLPTAQRDAVRALAGSARDAVTELYQLIGSLRGAADESPGAEAVAALVADFRAAGVHISVTGTVGPLTDAASRAVYRVVEEGLTNAVKHAPGRPVAIQLTRENDALVVTVTNPLTDDTETGGGFGLAGLAERVGAAGGFLDHRRDRDRFTLVAMLPTVSPSPPPAVGRTRATMVGLATAALLFVMLPASLLTGVS